jgi:heme A synthase
MAVVAYTTVIAALAGIFLPSYWGRRFALLLIASLFVQFGLGLLNVILLAPIWLQLVHLLFANVVWVALVLLTATVFAQQKARATVGAADSMLYNPKLKTVSGER